MGSNESALSAGQKAIDFPAPDHPLASATSEMAAASPALQDRTARVILVEDNADLLEGLRLTLESSGRFTCCAALTALPPDLGPLARLRTDLVLLDIHLQGVNALDHLPRLKSLLPNARIAIYSGDEDAEQVHKAVALGADGYVIKGLPRDALLATLDGILRGVPALCPRAVTGLFQHLRMPPPALIGQSELTPREYEIVDLLLRARRAKQIASSMGISDETVRTHIRNIYKKLDVSSRAELMLRFSPQLADRRGPDHRSRPRPERRRGRSSLAVPTSTPVGPSPA